MNTRRTLQNISSQLNDSMGVRNDDKTPLLSPVPNPKDVGRQGARNFGKISLDNVIPDPTQPRVEFDEVEIAQLAASILKQGQLLPIRVRWSASRKSWLIISGERRYRAAKRAGLKAIDCYFDEAELTQSDVLEQQLIENLLRSDLRPIEEAKAFQRLMQLNGWDGKTLAKSIHVTPSKVTRSLALLKLPEGIQTLVESGEVSPTAAYEVSKLPTPDQQAALQNNLANELISVKNARRHVQNRRSPKTRIRGTRQVFSTEGGWKVTVTSDRKGNYHEIAEALKQVADEVELRIDNNVRIT